MKTNVMPSIVQMEVEVFNNLVKEVKETVATGVALKTTTKPVFAAVDLWSIQRNMKSAKRYSRRSAF
ncbi:MAG TPA: hypothetical protein VLD19_11000 [Chitinophagaceae bacterium]|nr:hypothetical protein [Chitinophagaceae bacterium]